MNSSSNRFSGNFQVFILCGPGVSLNTFTSNPKDSPKALIPIANRPMVWYPMEWCYRAGLTDITLITPLESSWAIQNALSQNSHLTALPSPKPTVLAPANLTQVTGTAEIFRLPEVQKAITSDFIVLPCDFVCELDATHVLDTWMVTQGGLSGSRISTLTKADPLRSSGEDNVERKGGLGLWYSTTNPDGTKNKTAETDFVVTTALPKPVVYTPESSLRRNVECIVIALSTDTFKDGLAVRKSFQLRYSALKKFQNVKCRTEYRDAHVYFFPYWIKKFIALNESESFLSLSEDIIGWWAKSCWQEGLAEKLHVPEALSVNGTLSRWYNAGGNEKVDLVSLISTRTPPVCNSNEAAKPNLQNSSIFDSLMLSESQILSDTFSLDDIPRHYGYFHPSTESAPLMRRVDTVPLLLSTSLRLATIPPISASLTPGNAPAAAGSTGGSGAPSPFAHAAKIANPERIPKQCRVEAENSLLDARISVGERANVKECVIGANCEIGAGSRLLRCLLMEGVIVGENVTMSGCVVGRWARLEGGDRKDDVKTNLKDCEIQEGNVIPWGTDAKGEKFMIFEGLSENGDSDITSPRSARSGLPLTSDDDDDDDSDRDDSFVLPR